MINIKESSLPSYFLVHDAVTTIYEKRTDIMDILDSDINIIYKMFRFLSAQDDLKEYIFKYQTSNIEDKEYNLQKLNISIETIIKIVKNMNITIFDKYIEKFYEFFIDKDIIKLNNNLQNLHNEIIYTLQNYGIQERVV